mgnify:FL=1
MTKISKIFSILILCLLMPLALAAEDVSFKVQAPRQVIEGRNFQISFVLSNAEGSGISIPDVPGCRKLYGPATSTQQSYSWVNGKSTQSSSVSYTMTYRAEKAGKYNVGAAKITADGKSYSTSPFTLEVLPADKNSGGGSQGGSVQFDDPTTQTAGKKITSKDFFVRIALSKNNVYEQEAVVCTIKLYTKYQISQFMCTKQPSFDGFLIEELPLQAQLNSIENVGGQNYMTAELKRCILFPQKSGKLTITSGVYDVTLVQFEQQRTFFGIQRIPVEQQIQVSSNSSSVVITPLPEPQPATFAGAVGTFTATANLNPQSLKTFDAATYQIQISGTGNIKYLKAPSIAFPSQFEVYDPQSDVQASVSGSNVTGKVNFDYTFVPQYVGEYEIPKVVFTYFNPSTKKYVDINIDGRKTTVGKGKGGSGNINKGLEQKNKDILHIKTGDLHQSKEHSYCLVTFSYWLMYIIPALLLAFLLIYNRKKLKERANIQLLRAKKAGKVAQKRLKAAKQHLNNNDSSKFYAETLNAMYGYISDKLGIPGSNLNKDNVRSELINYGTTEALADEVIALLDKCEFAQYAPELSGGDMNEVYAEASDIMDKLQNTKKK